jgi:hypothetical protein
LGLAKRASSTITVFLDLPSESIPETYLPSSVIKEPKYLEANCPFV